MLFALLGGGCGPGCALKCPTVKAAKDSRVLQNVILEKGEGVVCHKT
jgi:hypothetical protein